MMTFQKKPDLHQFLAFAALLTLGVAGSLPARAVDDFDRLRERWKTRLTGGTGYDPADPVIAKRIAAIDAEARDYWQRMEKAPDRKHLWADAVEDLRGRDLHKNFVRLRAMALAYETRGSAFYHDAALQQAVVGGTEWMYARHYNPTIPRQTDYRWWFWQIGSPLQLNDIAVLLHEAFTPEQIARYTAAIRHCNPNPNHIVREGQPATGANRVWMFTVEAVRGILLKDAAVLADARDGLSDREGGGKHSVFAYATTGDGFYEDGSFLQHGKFAYTGGYGNSLLSNLAALLDLLADTPWRVTDPAHRNLYRWVQDAYEPVLYRGAVMDMVRGREASRPTSSDHAIGHQVVGSLLTLARFAPDSVRYQRLVKALIQADTYRDFFAHAPLYLIGPARRIVGDPRIAPLPEPTLHKQFPAMDRVVHRRGAPESGFALALSLSSSRVYNYESINDENLRGWYHAEGTTYLYNGDLGHFSDDYWATVDAHRLPGTTVDTRRREAVSKRGGQEYLSPNNWVGGAALGGQFGVAGLDLKADGSSLRARKAWFFFDDEIVCLGSGITATNGRAVETVVENRRLNAAGTNALTVNGRPAPNALGWSGTLSGTNWLHLAGSAKGADIGYFFPTAPTLNALREARTGSWRDINATSPDSARYTRSYLKLWFTHGPNPANETYAYVLLPNKTSTEVARYARTPDVRILANTPAVQAVRDTRLNVTGFAFWTDSLTTVEGVTADRKAAVLVREAADGFEVAVADPTQANAGTIALEINRPAAGLRFADPGVTVRQLSPVIRLIVDVKGARGRSFRASFRTSAK